MSGEDEVTSGPDLVRKSLAEAKAAARERGTAVTRRVGGRPAAPRRRTPAGDPVKFG